MAEMSISGIFLAEIGRNHLLNSRNFLLRPSRLFVAVIVT